MGSRDDSRFEDLRDFADVSEEAEDRWTDAVEAELAKVSVADIADELIGHAAFEAALKTNSDAAIGAAVLAARRELAERTVEYRLGIPHPVDVALLWREEERRDA